MKRQGATKPVESHVFDGMDLAVREQAEAAAKHQAEELTAEMLKPLGDINTKAGRIETDSPLFYGKVNPTLF